MKFEELYNLLNNNKNIELLPSEDISGEFDRVLKFYALDKYYEIEWWINLCYLHIDGVQVLFHRCNIDGCWPNYYKNNLNFYYNNDKIAVLPIEEYIK